MTAIDVPPSTCPVCGYRMDMATEILGDGDATPSPGDYSLCINCASVLVFDDALALAHPSHQQLQDAPEQLWHAQAVARKTARVTPRYERLPCGCIAGSEEVGEDRAFVFIPHALDCKYYRYVQDEMAASGKPTIVLDAR